MQEFLDVLLTAKLFDGINKIELLSLLHCLDAQEVIGLKGQILHKQEDTIDYVGIVACGAVHVSTLDSVGVENGRLTFHKGEMFGATLAFCSQSHLPISIVADTEAVILKINVDKLTQICSNACKFHNKILSNLLVWMAEKFVAIDTKLRVITKRTIREKALSYLEAAMIVAKNSTFEIPFNRQELADYLSVDRSSLSFELGKLKELGAIDFRKNNFTIIDISKANI